MNKVVLIGRLTSDAEVRTTQQGKYLIKFRLAVTRDYDKDKADFFNVTYFVTKASFGSYLKKGRLVSLAGRIEINDVEVEGVRKSYTNIIANEIQFLDKSDKGQVSTSEDISSTVVASQETVANNVIDDELPF